MLNGSLPNITTTRSVGQDVSRTGSGFLIRDQFSNSSLKEPPVRHARSVYQNHALMTLTPYLGQGRLNEECRGTSLQDRQIDSMLDSRTKRYVSDYFGLR